MHKFVEDLIDEVGKFLEAQKQPHFLPDWDRLRRVWAYAEGARRDEKLQLWLVFETTGGLMEDPELKNGRYLLVKSVDHASAIEMWTEYYGEDYRKYRSCGSKSQREHYYRDYFTVTVKMISLEEWVSYQKLGFKQSVPNLRPHIPTAPPPSSPPVEDLLNPELGPQHREYWIKKIGKRCCCGPNPDIHESHCPMSVVEEGNE